MILNLINDCDSPTKLENIKKKIKNRNVDVSHVRNKDDLIDIYSMIFDPLD